MKRIGRGASTNVSKLSAVRKKIYILVGFLIVAFMFAFALYRPSAPVIINVRFLGYTNVTGERFARFGITNQSGATIRRWGHFDREVRKSRALAYTRNLGPQVLLSAGQAEVVLVPLDAEPAATYQKDWRAVFYWRRENWQTRSMLWIHSEPLLTDWCPWLSDWCQRRGVSVNAAPSEWM